MFDVFPQVTGITWYCRVLAAPDGTAFEAGDGARLLVARWVHEESSDGEVGDVAVIATDDLKKRFMEPVKPDELVRIHGSGFMVCNTVGLPSTFVMRNPAVEKVAVA